MEQNASAAVKAYHSVTDLKLKAPIAGGIDKAVGDDPDALRRWHRVVLAWVACGWNPRNVKGMLQHFQDDKIPGDDQGQRDRGGGGQSIAQPGDIRDWHEVAAGRFGDTVWENSYEALLDWRRKDSANQPRS